MDILSLNSFKNVCTKVLNINNIFDRLCLFSVEHLLNINFNGKVNVICFLRKTTIFNLIAKCFEPKFVCMISVMSQLILPIHKDAHLHKFIYKKTLSGLSHVIKNSETFKHAINESYIKLIVKYGVCNICFVSY